MMTTTDRISVAPSVTAGRRSGRRPFRRGLRARLRETFHRLRRGGISPLGDLRATLRAIRTRWDQWRRRRATLGTRGERVARRWLRKKGFLILATGYRDPGGEIDLICVDQGCIVFVEVKTRTSEQSRPEDAVDDKKRRRISRAALTYLTRNELLEYPHRYDIIAIVWPENSEKPQIEHWPRAFPPDAPPNLFC